MSLRCVLARMPDHCFIRSMLLTSSDIKLNRWETKP